MVEARFHFDCFRSRFYFDGATRLHDYADTAAAGI